MDELNEKGAKGDKILLNRTEAAALLGLSRKTLELWDKNQVGPRVTRMPSGLPRYHINELARFATEGEAPLAHSHLVSQ
jgi:hypothetical protein